MAIQSDTYYCKNCGPINNVSKSGRVTCLNCGELIDAEANR